MPTRIRVVVKGAGIRSSLERAIAEAVAEAVKPMIRQELRPRETPPVVAVDRGPVRFIGRPPIRMVR